MVSTIQFPLASSKQPPESWMPFAKVEVAVVEPTSMVPVVEIPPEKDEVPESPTIVVVPVPPT